MNSSFIGKIDKAKKYAEERERVSIESFRATFRGKPQHLPGEFRVRQCGTVSACSS